MIFNSFRQSDEIAKPVDRPKSINIVYFEYLTISRIRATVSLIDKVKDFGAETEDWDNEMISFKYFANLLVIHFNGDINDIDEKFINLLFSSLQIFASWGELNNNNL